MGRVVAPVSEAAGAIAFALEGPPASGALGVAAETRYALALRATAPVDRVVVALEITHPDLAEPIRVVNDSESRVIEGHTYLPVRFGARLADDIEGQTPRAELTIDNVGRDLTQWIEVTGGGQGGTVRVIQALVEADAEAQWERTLDILSTRVRERIFIHLGFDPELDGPSVVPRFDFATAPGLY